MAYEVITIPGESTTYDDAPEVQIISNSSHRPIVIITYRAGLQEEGKAQLYGQIRFTGVLEYRWVDFDHLYSPYDDDQGEGFGLIQITDSKWIEAMASKGWFQKYPGQRFGPGVDESRIKHYRMTFDDYGAFDVIAFDFSVGEIHR
jgi:hypothetical protein